MTTSELIFTMIFVVGLAFLVFSFLFGELGDLVGDFGVDDADINSDSSADGPEWHDLKVIAAGLVGLGASGFIALQLDWPTSLAVAVSVIGFLIVAFVAFFGLLKPLSKQQSNTLSSRASYAGRTVKVVVPVTPTQIGQVEFFDDNGALVREAAKTSSKLLPSGSTVLIFEVDSDCVRVTEDPSNPIELQ